jgi:hypothetical protein
MNKFSYAAAALAAVSLMLTTSSATADDDTARFIWSTGIEYSTGTYGGVDDIEDLYIPLQGRIDFERVSFDLTLPYLSVRAPAGTTVTDANGEPIPGSGEVITESGLGDVIAGVTLYDLVYSRDLGIAIDLTGKIKFGTADAARGLGTGEQDYTVRTDLYKFFDQFTLLGSAGFKFRGDPADLDLENVWLGSVGGVYLPNEITSIGLIYDYRESAFAGGDAIAELSGFISRQIADKWSIQFYAFTGIGDSGADRGLGISLSTG